VVVSPHANATSRATVYAALVLVQVFFGLHYLASKVLLREIPPALWALMRVASAAVLLLATARLLGCRLPRSGKVLGRLALYSVFGVVINQLCFVEGLSRTTPSHSSILMAVIPVGTLLFAVLGRQERLTLAKAASFGVALAGVLLVLRPAATELAGASLAGDLLTVTNALSYSLFLVISKRLLERVDPLAATAVLLAFGTLGMLLPGLPALRGFDATAVSTRTWALGAFIVVFPTALAYLLNYWALARVQSSIVAFFIYLQPLIATSLSVAFLGDGINGWMIAGAALVFFAVYLALRPGPTERGTEAL
jgi:drug/metabolite transporter (DMT)-like permease